jgi:hypothetical protein
MRHRKISMVEERMSFLTEVMKVFVKTSLWELKSSIAWERSVRFAIRKRHWIQRDRLPIFQLRSIDYNDEIDQSASSDKSSVCHCLDSENIVVIESVERNLWISLYMDTYSWASRRDIERYRYEKRDNRGWWDGEEFSWKTSTLETESFIDRQGSDRSMSWERHSTQRVRLPTLESESIDSDDEIDSPSCPTEKSTVSLLGQSNRLRAWLDGSKSLESSPYGHIFLIVLMRHRKISIVEERMSFVTEVTTVFLINQSLREQTLYSSRMISPIHNLSTAFNSA